MYRWVSVGGLTQPPITQNKHNLRLDLQVKFSLVDQNSSLHFKLRTEVGDNIVHLGVHEVPNTVHSIAPPTT